MRNALADMAPAAPPTVVTGLSLAGLPLSDWVLIGNMLYIVVGMAYLLYKFWNTAKDRKNGCN